MEQTQYLLPTKLNLDDTPLNLKSDQAFFLRGINIETSIDAGNAGGNRFQLKPEPGNYLYTNVALPEGVNKVVGSFQFVETTQVYVWVENSNGNHLIYRINGKTRTYDIVYRFCPGYVLGGSPEYFVAKGRATIKSLCRYKTDGSTELYQELLWVDNRNENCRLDVEASIVTNSYTTPFFTPLNPNCLDCSRLIRVGVPTPMDSIKISLVTTNTFGQNRLAGKMFQFRVKYVNVWGQPSEHGLISDSFYLEADRASQFNKRQCLDITFRTPPPEINRVIIEVRKCTLGNVPVTTAGATNDGNVLSEWTEYETINLYDNRNTSLQWYERFYDRSNKYFEFVNSDKEIKYRFCNDKECVSIADADVRSSNPAPIKSSTVFNIGKGLAYGNNEVDLPYLPEIDVNKITTSLVNDTSCKSEYARIKVWVAVHNFVENQNNPVYFRQDKIGFGGFGRKPSIGNVRFEENVFNDEADFGSPGGHGQTFPAGVKNFRATLAGTGTIVEGKQFVWTPGSMYEQGHLTGDLDDLKDYMKDIRFGQKVLLQQFDFGLVKKGTYNFRLVGHRDTDNLENTSTYYRCNTPMQNYLYNFNINYSNFEKEILIDNTTGDYDSMEKDILAIVTDPTNPENFTSRGARVVRGYLKSGKTDKLPIEYAIVGVEDSGGPFQVSSVYTDHNGFFFYSRLRNTPNNGYNMTLKGENRCQNNVLLAKLPFKVREGTTYIPEQFITDRISDYETSQCNYVKLKGTLKQCQTGVAMPYVAVVANNARPIISDENGEYEIVLRNRHVVPLVRYVFTQNTSPFLDCNCAAYNIVNGFTIPSCVNCNARVYNAPDFYFRRIFNSGFEFGSRVPVQVVGHDWLGRQTPMSLISEVDIPTEQQQGGAVYSRIKITLPNSFSEICSLGVNKLTFLFPKNTLYSDFIEWAADMVEFVDSAGNVNNTAPTKIKIYYKSLNRYNLLKGKRTNTNWDIVSASDGTGKVGDVVEFIQQADGAYLPNGLESLVEYDQTGGYFLVDFNDNLKDLKEGVRFKLKRPYDCTEAQPYYEFSKTIYLCNPQCHPTDEDGNTITDFILDGVTSYLLERPIPVVKTVTNADGTKSEVVKSTTYPFRFEHHSPSDTWGDHCFNGGRVFFVNKYGGKKCNRDQILRTGALNYANDGYINYLHYFGREDELRLDENEFGDIVVGLTEQNDLMVICQHDTLTLRFDDNRAVVGNDGYVKLPTAKAFSRPEKQFGSKFGCQFKDINTISIKNGIVFYVDRRTASLIQHTFGEGKDVSQELGTTFILQALKSNLPGTYLVGDITADYKYNLTKYDGANYTRDENTPNISGNETITYDIKSKAWIGFRHYTPEYYATLEGEAGALNVFSFKGGLPYAHEALPNVLHLNYYGVQCRPYIGVVCNDVPVEKKVFNFVDVNSNQPIWLMDFIESEMGQTGHVYEGQWDYSIGLSSAPFLTEQEDGEGDSYFGLWIKVIFSTVPQYKGENFIINSIAVYFGI